MSKSWPLCREYLPTWRFSEKSLRNPGVFRAPLNLWAPRRTSQAPPPALGVMAKWSVFGTGPRGLGLKSEAPSVLSPNSSPEQAGGGGTKAGRGARAESGRVWRQFEAHLMAAQQESGAPTGGCSRGAPGSRFRGSGLAPDSAQSPPGSRPIESGFLGGTWTGPGRVLRHLLPLEV